MSSRLHVTEGRVLRLEHREKRGLIPSCGAEAPGAEQRLLLVVKLATASDAYNGGLLDYRENTNRILAIVSNQCQNLGFLETLGYALDFISQLFCPSFQLNSPCYLDQYIS